jgi:hypothetical protein
MFLSKRIKRTSDRCFVEYLHMGHTDYTAGKTEGACTFISFLIFVLAFIQMSIG